MPSVMHISEWQILLRRNTFSEALSICPWPTTRHETCSFKNSMKICDLQNEKSRGIFSKPLSKLLQGHHISSHLVHLPRTRGLIIVDNCRFGPYFVSPVIAGLQPDLTPYLAGTDSIGAIETAKDFMVAGTAPDSLLGMCESMWRPDMVQTLFHIHTSTLQRDMVLAAQMKLPPSVP